MRRLAIASNIVILIYIAWVGVTRAQRIGGIWEMSIAWKAVGAALSFALNGLAATLAVVALIWAESSSRPRGVAIALRTLHMPVVCASETLTLIGSGGTREVSRTRTS